MTQIYELEERQLKAGQKSQYRMKKVNFCRN